MSSTHPTTLLSHQQCDEISQALVDARLGAYALAEFPIALPDSLEDAYVIQTASIARWPDKVAGWKVGMVAPSHRSRFDDDRIIGPIFQDNVRRVADDAVQAMPVYAGGFAAVEAEFVLELARDTQPGDDQLDDAALAELVSDMYVGVEIASSPMAAINEIGPCAIVSDFGNNAGLIVGPRVERWHEIALDELKANVSINGDTVGQATATSIAGGPLEALRFLIRRNAKRDMALPKGTLVSTGAVTGVHDVELGARSVVDFPGYGRFRVEFAEREASS